MRVSIDAERCTGHARCAETCSTVFTTDEDGFAVLLVSDVPAGDEMAVRDAVAGCPEGAIYIN